MLDLSAPSLATDVFAAKLELLIISKFGKVSGTASSYLHLDHKDFRLTHPRAKRIFLNFRALFCARVADSLHGFPSSIYMRESLGQPTGSTRVELCQLAARGRAVAQKGGGSCWSDR